MEGFFTIVSKNYLGLAITLGDSLKEQHPERPFVIFLIDAGEVEREIPYQYYHLDANLELAFKYSQIEYCTAVKPSCFKLLHQKYNWEKIVYLDPDLYLYQPLNKVFQLLESHSVVVTPHFLTFQRNWTGALSENLVLRAGSFNLGFIAINLNQAADFVDYWENRLKKNAFDDRYQGLFTDQKWANFLPSAMGEKLYIIRDPGYNLSWWNIHEREIIEESGVIKVRLEDQESKPLTFFHFSNYSVRDREYMNGRHEDSVKVPIGGKLAEMFEKYSNAVIDNGHDYFFKLDYEYNCFNNGAPITTYHRRMFRVICDGIRSNILDQKQKDLHRKLNSISNSIIDPFDHKGLLYKVFKKSGLISFYSKGIEVKKKERINSLLVFLLRILFLLLGPVKYFRLMGFLADYSRPEFQSFLLRIKK